MYANFVWEFEAVKAHFCLLAIDSGDLNNLLLLHSLSLTS